MGLFSFIMSIQLFFFFFYKLFHRAVLVIPSNYIYLSGAEGHCCLGDLSICAFLSLLTLNFPSWDEIALSLSYGVGQRTGNE